LGQEVKKTPKDQLSKSMDEAMRRTIDAHRKSQTRRRLADLLSAKATMRESRRMSTASDIAAAVASLEAQDHTDEGLREELTNTVKNSQLEDFKLEYCTRRVLGLSMSVGTVMLNGQCNWTEAGMDAGFISGSFHSESTEPWQG